MWPMGKPTILPNLPNQGELTMPYSIATPQTSTIQRNYVSTIDIDIDANNNAGSGVYIGNGITLTAGHVIDQSEFTFANWSLSAGEGNAWGAFGGNIDFGILQDTQTPTSPINVYNVGNYGGYTGQDIGILQVQSAALSTATNSGLANIPTNRMIIFSDPGDAIGRLWTGGYVNSGTPTNPSPVPVGDSETLAETGSAGLVDLNYVISDEINNDGNLVRRSAWEIDSSTGYQIFQGFSGSGFWLEYDVNGDGTIATDGTEQFLAGIVSQFEQGSTSYNSIIEPIGDAYQQTSNLLFVTLTMNPNDFATNVLIADQDGLQNPITEGTGFNEEIHGRNSIFVDDDIRSEGGNDTIFASLGDDAINGGSGFDTVDYRGITTNGDFEGVWATINGATITVEKRLLVAGGTDTLTGIEGIEGTVIEDNFTVASMVAGVPVLINGQSNAFDPSTPQEPLGDLKNTVVSELPPITTSGGRYLSSEQAMSASNLNFMIDGTEDTITLAQALWDAGAQVTYYSAFGEGIIYLNGVQIGYTGVHFEPTQTDFFGGIPQGGSVGLTDTGTTTLDLSGVVGAITDTLLSGITLWNLVDEIEVGAGDVSLDLGAFGIDTYDASKSAGRSPNILSSGQNVDEDGHGNGAAGFAANDNVCVLPFAA